MDEPHLAPFVAIVDDEEPVRIALGRLLGAMGLRAQGFADGTSFLVAEPVHAAGVQPISVIVNWSARVR